MENTEIVTAMPFPSINWWINALNGKSLIFNDEILYKKDQPKNRYLLTGSQGKQMLSIPLSGGRSQSTTLGKVKIANNENWQSQHWKTIKTLYQRSPFFEFFELDFSVFFQKEIDYLNDWNKESIFLINRLLKLNLQFSSKNVQINKAQELSFQPFDNEQRKSIEYHQVFQEKVGFQPNCSILDLLFCEGNNAHLLLKST